MCRPSVANYTADSRLLAAWLGTAHLPQLCDTLVTSAKSSEVPCDIMSPLHDLVRCALSSIWSVQRTFVTREEPEAHEPNTLMDFFVLPPELRNRVYEYAVVGAQRVDITTERQPGLVNCNKMVRSECMPMYYAFNVFTFTPQTQDKDALKTLERWLTRIGPANCQKLRRIHLTLTLAVGSMIDKSWAVPNPWPPLVAQLENSGCPRGMCLTIDLHKDVKPSAKAFKEGILALGSRAAAWERVKHRRREMTQAVTWYLKLPDTRQHEPVQYALWAAAQYPDGNLMALMREGAYWSDCTSYWSGGTSNPRPHSFPYQEMWEAILKWSDRFGEP